VQSANLDDVAWDIGRMVFDTDFKPRPIPKLSYEVSTGSLTKTASTTWACCHTLSK
jgi:hypothetical protein